MDVADREVNRRFSVSNHFVDTSVTDGQVGPGPANLRLQGRAWLPADYGQISRAQVRALTLSHNLLAYVAGVCAFEGRRHVMKAPS